MYSKKISIANADLSDNKKLESIYIEDEQTSINEGTKSVIRVPKAVSFYNTTGKSVDLKFLSSGEVSEYEGNDKFEGVRVANEESIHINPLSTSHFVEVVAEDTIASPIILSFYNYV